MTGGQQQRRWPLWLVIGAVMIGGLILLGIAQGPSSDPAPTNPAGRTKQYQQDRAFCEGRATDEALATDGLHSVGGGWWTDRVNQCLLAKD